MWVNRRMSAETGSAASSNNSVRESLFICLLTYLFVVSRQVVSGGGSVFRNQGKGLRIKNIY